MVSSNDFLKRKPHLQQTRMVLLHFLGEVVRSVESLILFFSILLNNGVLRKTPPSLTLPWQLTPNIRVCKHIICINQCHENYAKCTLIIEKLCSTICWALNQNMFTINGTKTVWKVSFFIEIFRNFKPFRRILRQLK